MRKYSYQSLIEAWQDVDNTIYYGVVIMQVDERHQTATVVERTVHTPEACFATYAAARKEATGRILHRAQQGQATTING